MPSQQKNPTSIKSVNKVALITGAAKRIGKEIAKELHQSNINIVLHFNNAKNEAKILCDEFNRKRANSALPLSLDLTSPNADKLLIDRSLQHFNRLDYLVNNASIFFPTPFMHSNSELVNSFLRVNSLVPRRLMKRAAPILNINKGAIVNIIDIYANRGLIDHTHYVASKNILMELTKEFAHSLAPEVRVNAVSPGAILWPESNNNEVSKQADIIENSALKRLGRSKEISQTVRYLLLEATYTTGANINVDGGRSLYI